MRCRHGAVSAAVIAVATAVVAGGEVKLSTGDVLYGTIVEQGDEQVVLEHPLFGRMQIAAATIESIVDDQLMTAEPASPDAPTTTTTPARAPRRRAAMVPPAVGATPLPSPMPAETTAPKPAAPATDEEKEAEREWASNFALGFGASSGTIDEQNFNVRLGSVRETPVEKTDIQAAYFFAKREGDRRENRLSARVQHDWLFPESAWLLFVQGQYDAAEFQSYDQRIGGHAGLGVDVIDSEAITVTLRSGGGAVREYGSEEDMLRPEGQMSGEVTWHVSERQEITAKSTVFPDLSELEEFRTVTSAGWSYKLDPESSAKLTLGLLHEYESRVDPGVASSDLRVFGGLGFDF